VLAFVIRRLIQIIPVVFGVSVVVFGLLKLVPGDIASTLLGAEAQPAEVAALRARLGLDQPLIVQYLLWLTRALQGDLGVSLETGVPVTVLVMDRLRNSLILVTTAMFLATVVGILVGVVSALRPRSIFDRAGMLFVLFGNSVPAFWLGILLILVFSLELRWFPVSGMYSIRGDRGILDLLHHLVLPSVTLGVLSMAIVARITRSGMIEVLQQDYIRTATAKGLRPVRVVMVHALRNSLLPVVTVVGLQFGYSLGGAVLTETVFAWPGLGYQLFRAIASRDLPIVQGSLLIIATAFVLINAFVDVLYSWIDPRIRYA
jgi:peptide/nickel transport system permease protein